MSTLDVLSVLSDSKDTAERVLDLLSLAALGSLSCTCKALRASVAAAPRAWKAAAARQYPSSHPIQLLDAISIHSYLQQQHVVHQNIIKRQCTCVQRDFPAADWSYLAPNGSVHAKLHSIKVKKKQRTYEFRLHDAMTSQLLHTWPMPAQPYLAAEEWAWRDDSTALILPFGGGWHGRSTGDLMGSGFVVLTVRTGTSLVVMLPPPDQLPSKGRFRMHPPQFVGRHVMVPHPGVGPSSEGRLVWIYSCADGSHVASYRLIQQGVFEVSMARRFWAPSGQVAAWAMPTSEHPTPGVKQTLCTWHPAVGPPLMLPGQAASEDGWCAWSPASDTMLVHTDKSAVTLFDPQGQVLCPPQLLGFNAMFGAWSPVGAVAIASPKELRLYRMAGNALVLQQKVPVSVAKFRNQHFLCSPLIPNQVLSFSPSGSHVLVMLQAGLAIVDVAGRVKHVWQQVMHANDAVCWASDAVVVQKSLPTMSDAEDSREAECECTAFPFDWPSIEARFLCFA